MNCSACGELVPEGAMFCGECGRSVSASDSRAVGRPPVAADRVPAGGLILGAVNGTEANGTDTNGTDANGSEATPAHDTCSRCGEPVGVHDIFCGECGHVVRASSLSSARAGDTAIIDPAELRGLRTDSAPRPAPSTSATSRAQPPANDEPAPAAPAPRGESGRRSAGSHLIEPPPAPDPPRLPTSLPPSLPPALPPTGAPASSVVIPPARPSTPLPSATDDDDIDDLEATRIVSSRRGGERLVLQFSTGESVTITGTALIGRNPRPEPGEHFDHLVRVLDPSRSVSKTHLEIGQDSGVVWIRDRYSGNGSVVREPERSPVRCDAGKRYRIERGARIDIGEQFFIVS